jgi:N-acetyl sugar amidotransferase
MPETWAGITFDKEGVCNMCRQAERKVEVNWAERQKWLKEILNKYKEYAKSHGNKYDCMITFSGGKDSTYALWAAVKKYGMKPLVVTFDHGFVISPEGEWNLMEMPKRLDCDHLRFTLGNGLRNGLCRKGSEVNGDFCWHCHNGVGALPARISQQWDIPLQIWGEPSAEYQSTYRFEDLEEQNKEHFEKVFQLGVTPEIIVPPGYEPIDLLPMTWPEGKFDLKAIYLGNFEPWNQREQVDIITRELGWKHRQTEGTYVDWDKVDCPYEPIRDYQKFMKRNFGRTHFQASKDIRLGLLTREKALELAEKFDGKRPSNFDEFLKDINMTEAEFNKISKKHIVPRSNK